MGCLEEQITIPDGRTITVHGRLAWGWRQAKSEGTEEQFLDALQEYVNESLPQ